MKSIFHFDESLLIVLDNENFRNYGLILYYIGGILCQCNCNIEINSMMIRFENLFNSSSCERGKNLFEWSIATTCDESATNKV